MSVQSMIAEQIVCRSENCLARVAVLEQLVVLRVCHQPEQLLAQPHLREQVGPGRHVHVDLRVLVDTLTSAGPPAQVLPSRFTRAKQMRRACVLNAPSASFAYSQTGICGAPDFIMMNMNERFFAPWARRDQQPGQVHAALPYSACASRDG
jgi:hypothetical protein